MSQRIIKPEGMELIQYLNEGYAICNQCGAIMERRDDPKGGCDIYICPSCGWEIDEMEYEYEDNNEWTETILGMNHNNVPPVGCQACGGPYPHCKISCKLFDD